MPWVYEDKTINIKELDWNPRIDLKKLKSNFRTADAGLNYYINKLVSSIKEKGLFKPLIVKPKKEGKYKVVAGHHRAEALKRLGKKMIPCRIQTSES